jgi:hypothetical protein
MYPDPGCPKTCGSGSVFGYGTLILFKKNKKSLFTSSIYLNIDCRMSEAEFASGQKRAQLIQKLAGTVPEERFHCYFLTTIKGTG